MGINVITLANGHSSLRWYLSRTGEKSSASFCIHFYVSALHRCKTCTREEGIDMQDKCTTRFRQNKFITHLKQWEAWLSVSMVTHLDSNEKIKPSMNAPYCTHTYIVCVCLIFLVPLCLKNTWMTHMLLWMTHSFWLSPHIQYNILLPAASDLLLREPARLACKDTSSLWHSVMTYFIKLRCFKQ